MSIVLQIEFVVNNFWNKMLSCLAAQPSKADGSVDCIQLILLYPVCKGEFWSGKWDSNSRSPAPKAGALSQTKLHPEKFGATRRIRTSHPCVRSTVFYPNELWSPVEFESLRRFYRRFIQDLPAA